MKLLRGTILAAAAAVFGAGLLSATPAEAHGNVFVGVGFGVGGGFHRDFYGPRFYGGYCGPVFYCPPPAVIYESAPVVYAPAPVYVQQPVVVQQQPVIIQQQPVAEQPAPPVPAQQPAAPGNAPVGYAPPVYAPPTVVYSQPAPVYYYTAQPYYAAPVYVPQGYYYGGPSIRLGFSFGFHGHR